MVNIILLILKFIGITLLSVIGLILLIAVLVLFVPVRYKISAGKKGEEIKAQVKITWLIHIISVSASYLEDRLEKAVRLFGINILKLKKKPKKEKNKKEKKTKQPESGERKSEELEYADISMEEIKDGVGYEFIESVDDGSDNVPNLEGKEKTSSDHDNSDDEADEQNDKQSFISRLKEFISKISEFFKTFGKRIEGIKDRIKNFKGSSDKFIKIVTDERNKAAFSLCAEQIFAICRNIKPKIFRLYIHFGTDDPAFTGQLLAIFAMLYPFMQDSLTVESEMDISVFDTDMLIKGRVTVFVLIKAAWKVYFNKDFKRLRRMLKR